MNPIQASPWQETELREPSAAGTPAVPSATLAWLRSFNTLALAALIGWICYDALGRNVFGDTPWPESVVDYRIMHEQSRQVVSRLAYDPAQIFPYAPPAVFLFALSAVPPLSVAAAIWLALLASAAIGVFVLGSDLVGLRGSPVRWIAALLTYVVTNNYFQWDLRSLNCNSLYAVLLVGAVHCMARSFSLWAGSLLAASIALKLYPVLVLPYLLWTRRLRAAFVTFGCLLVLFVLLPLVYAGPMGMTRLYGSWFEQLRLATATKELANHPILIAIPHGLAKVLGPDSQWVAWLSGTAKAFWIAAVGLCLLSGGLKRERARSGWELCVDAFALALLPVVISPYLESYHVVLAAPPILAMLAYGVVAPFDRNRWAFSVIVVLAGWGLLYAFGQWKLRGLGVLAQMSLLFLALAIARLDLRKRERAFDLSAQPGGIA